ncbi:MAG: hypothetical protein JO046_19395 [Solirubrobacterales bacterium]|nr:hypothetical protein [Solirubrobacterales bacterium]
MRRQCEPPAGGEARAELRPRQPRDRVPQGPHAHGDTDLGQLSRGLRGRPEDVTAVWWGRAVAAGCRGHASGLGGLAQAFGPAGRWLARRRLSLG